MLIPVFPLEIARSFSPNFQFPSAEKDITDLVNGSHRSHRYHFQEMMTDKTGESLLARAIAIARVE